MHQAIVSTSRWLAIAGGVVLSVLILIVVISILGRELNSTLHGDFFQNNMQGFADWVLALKMPGFWGKNGIEIGPFNGDYELVEAGIAFAIFAFLPYTQVTGGHATVDIFTSWWSARAQRILTAVIDIVFAVVLVIIAVQLLKGTMDKFSRGQTTYLLQFPIWYAYAFSMVGATLGALVGIYMAVIRVIEAATGKTIADGAAGGAEH
ncbi:MAG: TRAP transporter small permease [Maritimibacter sp.]